MNHIEILVLTHGKFGEELVNSAKMIIGEMENVRAISLLPEMSANEYTNNVRDYLNSIEGDILCLVDLFGGTPANTILGLSREFDVNIVTGVNLPMLIDVYLKKESNTGQALANAALEALIESGKNVSELLNKSMEEK